MFSNCQLKMITESEMARLDAEFPFPQTDFNQAMENYAQRKVAAIISLEEFELNALERMRQVLNEIDPPLDGSILTLKALISDIIRQATEEFFKNHNVMDDPDFWDD
jgi:hypothetical protein